MGGRRRTRPDLDQVHPRLRAELRNKRTVSPSATATVAPVGNIIENLMFTVTRNAGDRPMIIPYPTLRGASSKSY
jgi:hypothetical protein